MNDDYMKNPSDPLWAIKHLEEVLKDDSLSEERKEELKRDINLLKTARVTNEIL